MGGGGVWSGPGKNLSDFDVLGLVRREKMRARAKDMFNF